MNDYFILENGQPIKVDHLTWAKWFGGNDRNIAQSKKGNVSVSTVFLGLNHQFGNGPPLIFETMIFGGEHDQYQDRCSTVVEAQDMHEKACKLAFGEEP